jgi:hypothetical protein
MNELNTSLFRTQGRLLSRFNGGEIAMMTRETANYD